MFTVPSFPNNTREVIKHGPKLGATPRVMVGKNMRRAIPVSLSLLTLAWMAGCGIVSGGGGGIGSTQPNAFSGQYAFFLAGFDSNGLPIAIAGSMKADGLGNISGGEVDVNDNGTVSSNSSLTGTYLFDATGNNTLGTIMLTNLVTNVAQPLGFAFSLQASGGFGSIMSLDANNFIAEGTMELQSASALSLSAMAGDWVVTINGRISSIPTSALGRFTLASSGATSNVAFDRSVAGSTAGTAGPTTGASATVTFAGAGPDAIGRGTFTLALNDALANGTQNFAYYAITAKRFIAVETDANGTLIADFASQSTPLIASTVVTTGSVFGLAGVDNVAGGEITAVGQLQITGANTGTLHLDSNDNGAIVSGATLPIQTVTFDPTIGRGTLAAQSGYANGLADSMVFYLTAPGMGFIMDATAGSTNRAMAGPLMAQAGAPYSAFTDLSGLGIVRSRGSSVNDALALVGLFGLQSGSSKYELLFDQRFPGSTGIQTQTDSPATGISLLGLDASVGRGTVSVPSGSNVATEVFYVIGPNQFYFIDISPLSSGLIGASSLFFVTPQ